MKNGVSQLFSAVLVFLLFISEFTENHTKISNNNKKKCINTKL